MIIYILGEYPRKVSVMAKSNIPEIEEINDFDSVTMIFSFESGCLAVVDLSRQCSYGYDQRVEVFGSQGMLKVENQQPVYNLQSFSKNGVKTAPISYSFASRYERSYQEEMRYFLNVLQGLFCIK